LFTGIELEKELRKLRLTDVLKRFQRAVELLKRFSQGKECL